jgi:hypothetical protein
MSLYRPYQTFSSLLVFAFGVLACDGQVASISDEAEVGPRLAGGVVGIFDQPPLQVPNRKMPDGAVTGNGDMALVLGGPADQLALHIGKSDFWGVERGAIVPVGTALLETAELQGASYHVEQMMGQAIIAGKFSKPDGHELSFQAWVAQPDNLLVVELTNTGSQPLSQQSTLINPDPLNIPGNAATFSATTDSTFLVVSPDVVRLELGNHLAGKVGAPFCGKIADFQLFDEALPGAVLPKSDAQKPLLEWSAARAHAIDPSGIVLDPRDEHGGSADFSGAQDQDASPGALCLPQKGFTVTAWVRATDVSATNTILAAVAAEDPVKYPFYHGFNLSLVNGKLSATLNDCTAAAADPFPLNQWVKVAAIYDVKSLTLYVDGREVGRNSQFPTASDQMGWNKRAIHLGDPDVPLSGCAPAGLFVQRVLGVTASVRDQALCWKLEPGAHATFLVSVVTDRNTSDYQHTAKQLVMQDAASLRQLHLQHEQWWRDFWSQSFVQIPDRAIQDNWYASLYLLACASRADCSAPGLWGNYATTLKMAWQGDYTLNYNYQAPFWAAYASNHLELADNYEKVLLDHLPRGRAIARFAQDDNDRWFPPPPFAQEPPLPPKYRGILFYMHLIPLPGWSNDYNTFIGQKSEALFCAVNMVQRWRYTRDVAYAKKVYPFLKETADFWDHYLVLQNGRYVDLDDAAAENTGANTNPATTLAFLRLVYPCLLEMSTTLHVDEDRRAKWQNILAHLSDYTIVPASSLPSLAALPVKDIQNRNVIRDAEVGPDFPTPLIELYRDRKQRSSSAGMNCTQVIFPGWAVGVESPAKLQQAALASVDLAAEWYDYNDDCTFYPSAAAVGYDSKEILANLDGLLASSQFPNGMISTGGGGTEDFAIVPVTLAAMFLQSYQENIHVFPNWPRDEDAAFGNLPACGGFLVSSAIAKDRVQYVKIVSKAGEECRLANPWPEHAVQVSVTGRSAQVLSGTVIRFGTQTSESVILTPKD